MVAQLLGDKNVFEDALLLCRQRAGGMVCFDFKLTFTTLCLFNLDVSMYCRSQVVPYKPHKPRDFSFTNYDFATITVLLVVTG